MFQEAEFSEIANSVDSIQSFVTSKNLLVLVNDRNIVTIQSLTNMKQKTLCLQQQFLNILQHSCPIVRQINQLNTMQNDTIVMLTFNEAVCLILISLQKSKDIDQNNQEIFEIKTIKFINIKRQLQFSIQVQKKCSFEVIEAKQNMAYFSFVIQNQQFFVISLRVTNSQLGFNIEEFQKCRLLFYPNQYQTNLLISMLKKSGFQIKKFRDFVYIFNTQTAKDQSNILLIYDLRQRIGKTVQMMANMEFQSGDIARVLYDVIFVYSPNQFCQTAYLFYNEQISLIVVEINLKNPSVSVKRKKCQNTLMYRMLKVSMTPQLVQLKGYQYAFNNLHFIIQGKSRVDFESKLLIIGSPRANSCEPIVNQIHLPQGFQHFTMNSTNDLYCICQHKLYKVDFVSKQSLYQKLLSGAGKLDSIKHVIEDLLE